MTTTEDDAFEGFPFNGYGSRENQRIREEAKALDRLAAQAETDRSIENAHAMPGEPGDIDVPSPVDYTCPECGARIVERVFMEVVKCERGCYTRLPNATDEPDPEDDPHTSGLIRGWEHP